MRRFLTGLFVVGIIIAVGCAEQSPPASDPVEPTPEQSLVNDTSSQTPTSTPPPTIAPTETPTPTRTPTSTPIPTPTFSPGRVILPTVAIPTATPRTTQADPVTEQLDEIGVRTAVLRELFSLRRVDREMITRAELDEHLIEDLDEDRDDIAKSQMLYQTLGIIGPQDDLYDILLKLLGESVLGFYEPEEEKMYVVRDSDELTATDVLTYAHEYAHSLQQQHFDIHAIRESVKGNSDSDRERAYRAFVEGDATLTQTAYFFQNLSADQQRAVIEESLAEPPEAFQSAPYVIRREIGFPYTEGFNFNFALFQSAGNDWDLINETYEGIPQSTEQILHPEKYVSQESPIEVDLPNTSESIGEGWEQADTDTFGEFFLRTFMETEILLEQASTAAAGWGGDTFSLLSGPDDARVVVSKATWDSEDDAQEFYEAFLEFMVSRTEGEWQPHEDDEMTQIIVTSEQGVLLSIDTLNTLLIFADNADLLEVIQTALQQ